MTTKYTSLASGPDVPNPRCAIRVWRYYASTTRAERGLPGECHFVPEYAKLISAGNIKYPYGPVSACGHNIPTVPAERRAVHRTIMNSPAVGFFPTITIPHARRAISRCSHDPLAIRAECRATHDASVPPTKGDLFSVVSLPEPYCPIGRGCHHSAIISAERSSRHGAVISFKEDDLFSAFGVP